MSWASICKIALRKVPFALVTMGLGSCVTHVENLHPTFSEAGAGKILAVESVTGETGESAADRYAMGFAVGGVPGALIVGNSEKDIGRSTLFNYTLQLSDGSSLTVRSFSPVSVNDCVKIIRVSTKTDVVLERLDKADRRCEVGRSN
jgi:hypothetical protein